MLKLVLSTLILATLVGCGDSSEPEKSTSQPAGGAAVDLSTPESAVKTFFAAAKDKNVDALAQCFSPNCEGEFRPFVEKAAPTALLGELAEMFSGASVTGVDAGDDPDRATVHVALTGPREKESLEMVREDGKWRIVGF